MPLIEEKLVTLRPKVATKGDNRRIMAIAIREIPVLTGQSAIDFVNEADKYAERPVPHLSQQREMELRSIKEAHKHFIW